jgi:hypothetical protein
MRRVNTFFHSRSLFSLQSQRLISPPHISTCPPRAAVLREVAPQMGLLMMPLVWAIRVKTVVGKTGVLGEKPVLIRFSPPQIPHEPTGGGVRWAAGGDQPPELPSYGTARK